MYIYRFDDEITKQLADTIKTTDKGKKIQELEEKLANIDKKFNIDNSNIEKIEPSLELKKLEEIEIDEDKIRERAENELSDFKSENLEKIETEKLEKETELNNNKKSLIENNDYTKDKLKSSYETARENTSNDALKRGLARSSIVINMIDAFNKDEIETYKKLDEELNDNINAINFELNALTQKQQQALDEFDITYAAKLNSKINDLTNELKEKQEEIIKYNNEIAKSEEDYKIKYENLKNDMADSNFDKDVDLVELYAKYGTNAVNKYRESLVYEAVKEYLLTVTKTEAKHYLVNNKNIKEQLGTYYNQLLKEFDI